MARMMIDRIRAWLKKHEAERAIVRLLHSRSGVVGALVVESRRRVDRSARSRSTSARTPFAKWRPENQTFGRALGRLYSHLFTSELDVAFLCNAIEFAARDGTIGAGLEIIDAGSGTPPSFRIHDSRPK